MDCIEITLPWPPAKLSPNARGHWRTKENARTEYKKACFLIAGIGPAVLGNIHLVVTFHPPTKAHRDLDNCLAAIKYGLDGVAERWGINDKLFRPITIDMGEPVKGGAVVIKTAAYRDSPLSLPQ